MGSENYEEKSCGRGMHNCFQTIWTSSTKLPGEDQDGVHSAANLGYHGNVRTDESEDDSHIHDLSEFYDNTKHFFRT